MKETYNPKIIEQILYKSWEQNGYFKPSNDLHKDNYCIVTPPPNITGNLHMGHAFQQVIMDILIRYQRMQGKNTLWQTGTDHAGIATQIIMEKKISIEENKTRYDYGRDAFIDKIWQWKKKTSNTIANQMRRLGHSIDWERERFTLDDMSSKAVQKVFVHLYQENLIYRGKRLVNWDPELCTAISDLEVENRELKGSTWYLRYPLANGVKTISGLDYLIIATTRPESMLGDTGIAVNPKDQRYCNLIGQFITLPLVGRRIRIIGDKYADINKGSGCVKITPAHDFNDYEVAQRHALPMINILTFDGNIRQEAEVFNTDGSINQIISKKIPVNFRGLKRCEARKAIVSELNRLGFLIEVKNHNITIPYGDRSGVIIEPMLTDQWYLRMQPLMEIAVEAVQQGKIQFVPKQYENMYFSWMRDIKDWCISRQIWWGHRIPAWYNSEGQVYVGHCEVEIRKKYQLSNDTLLYQDDDVLDTWFSSSLWSFSALGWPENTKALRMFHPTNVVVSGFDIIFFWIARMIMLTMHFIKNEKKKPQVPFKTIYITGLIRDEEGQKMSKSKGNIIDPLDMIDGISLEDLIKKRTKDIIHTQLADKIKKCTEKKFPDGIKPHGTDAVRFTLAALSSTSRDINWDMKRLEGYRNFCNKLWNAGCFVLIHSKNQDCGFNNKKKVLSLADRWITTEFNQTVNLFREALDKYRFDLAANILYEFTWKQFCDWYLEMTKSVIRGNDNAELRGTLHVLVKVLEALLRLAHPIIPFITETIWKKIKNLSGQEGDTIMLQKFPVYDVTLSDPNASIDLEWIKKIIITIRAIRSKMHVSPIKSLTIFLCQASPEIIRRVNENRRLILSLGRIHDIVFLSENEKRPISVTQHIDGAELLIPKTNLIDKYTELKRLEKETKHIEKEISRIISRLNNKNLIIHVPETVLEKERKKLKTYQQYKVKLAEQKRVIAKL